MFVRLTSLDFVDYTANDITSEQKRSIPAYKLTNEMTTCQVGTGLDSKAREVQRIFVKRRLNKYGDYQNFPKTSN